MDLIIDKNVPIPDFGVKRGKWQEIGRQMEPGVDSIGELTLNQATALSNAIKNIGGTTKLTSRDPAGKPGYRVWRLT